MKIHSFLFLLFLSPSAFAGNNGLNGFTMDEMMVGKKVPLLDPSPLFTPTALQTLEDEVLNPSDEKIKEFQDNFLIKLAATRIELFVKNQGNYEFKKNIYELLIKPSLFQDKKSTQTSVSVESLKKLPYFSGHYMAAFLHSMSHQVFKMPGESVLKELVEHVEIESKKANLNVHIIPPYKLDFISSVIKMDKTLDIHNLCQQITSFDFPDETLEIQEKFNQSSSKFSRLSGDTIHPKHYILSGPYTYIDFDLFPQLKPFYI